MAMKMEMGVVKGVGYREWMHGETRERGLSLQHKPSPTPSLSNLIPVNLFSRFLANKKKIRFLPVYPCRSPLLHQGCLG